MTDAPNGEARERAIRWIEEGHRMLGVLVEVVHDYDRLESRLEATERECAQLREEVGRLRAETERFGREREEIARALTKLATELLRQAHPPDRGNRAPPNSQRGGKVTYMLRQTQPGVTELVEVKR